jgi:ATP-binding cassette subfamily B (MDR/TAP) protein 1
MRRPTALAVATDLSRDDTKDVYELSQQSPRSLAASLPPAYDCEKGPEPVPTTTTATTAEETPAGPAPSIALLFSCLSRRDLLLFVLPAVLTSMLDGGVAPFMTRVIGNQFDVFAAHPLHGATAADNRALLHGVGMAALELLGLSAAALVLSSLTSSLWICAGERNVAAVRKRVFGRVADMPMSWFDTHMGTDGSVQSEGGPIGAGGLMAKFAR